MVKDISFWLLFVLPTIIAIGMWTLLVCMFQTNMLCPIGDVIRNNHSGKFYCIMPDGSRTDINSTAMPVFLTSIIIGLICTCVSMVYFSLNCCHVDRDENEEKKFSIHPDQ
jgi:hypothetical protein